MFKKILAATEISDFNNYMTKSKYYEKRKMKPKMKLLVLRLKNFLDWSQDVFVFSRQQGEHKQAKAVVATISHNGYKDALLNNKCLIYSLNRIQSKNHRIKTYEINKISLSSFEGKIYIQNNRYDGLDLGYYN